MEVLSARPRSPFSLPALLLRINLDFRVHESLQLFNEIANSTHLSGAAVILFMNKKDLFEQKIREVDLTVTFPEYAGISNFSFISSLSSPCLLSLHNNAKLEIMLIFF